MKILFTGKGSSGSWAIRGSQLGTACGAAVIPKASADQCKAPDMIVVVKRLDEALLANVRSSGRPWAYDVLDAYPQPACNTWTRTEAIAWTRKRIGRLAPNAVIWPNRRMQEDVGLDLPGLVLPHHHRPGIGRNPIRPRVRWVGYEGSSAYLGPWLSVLEDECERRGWDFVTNPSKLDDLDIVVAFRGGDWESYPATHWKSNVKLANAHGSGTPFVGQRECGYLETASGAEYWAWDHASLKMSFDWLADQSTREQVSERFLQRAFTVDQAAEQLQTFLHGL